tara:strand:- start:197 stop:586 length:390 start_codon:yes stop_codon:yes gene_type:complete
MVQATVNTTNTIYMTLKESVIDVPTFTNYLMRIYSNLGEHTCIVSPSVDTARYSQFSLDLSQDDKVNGAVLITESGEYKYEVYGQTNATNLDHTDGVIVGLLEKGTINIISGTTLFDSVASTIEKDVQL